MVPFITLTLLLLPPLVSSQACNKIFKKYYPSPFEEDWVSNIIEYQENICMLTTRKKHRDKFKKWLDLSDAIEQENSNNEVCGSVRQQVEQDNDIFSMMEYQYVCPKTKHPLNGQHVNESIEPLVGFLRDPRPVCLKKKTTVKLEDKNFILFSNLKCNKGAITRARSVKPPRLIILDLGSTTFMYSLSGPSQSYLYNKYTSFGYTNLERFLAWEARPYPKTQGYFDQVPVEVMPHYQFFNVKINAEKGGRYNPLTLLKAIAKPRDFVSLKLDVDNSDIEFDLIDQIVNDTEVSGLIDEFFFEHHSNVKEFQWAWKEQVWSLLLLSLMWSVD